MSASWNEGPVRRGRREATDFARNRPIPLLLIVALSSAASIVVVENYATPGPGAINRALWSAVALIGGTIAAVVFVLSYQLIRAPFAQLREARLAISMVIEQQHSTTRSPSEVHLRVVVPSEENVVRLAVLNRGRTTAFKARVLAVAGAVDQGATPWNVRWRGELALHPDSREITTGTEEVLELARVRPPHALEFLMPAGQVTVHHEASSSDGASLFVTVVIADQNSDIGTQAVFIVELRLDNRGYVKEICIVAEDPSSDA